MNTDMEIPPSSISIFETRKVVKKKAGRKPTPTSPALRKAQNRVAQQAFRERKQQYLKQLELDYKRLSNERDKYHKKSDQLCKENDILKCENWYLKGIVLSLQLVCFRSKLCIPKHTPHIDDRALQVMAESAPASIATYIDVNYRHPSPLSNDGSTSDYSIQSSISNDDNNQSPPPPPLYPSSGKAGTIQFHHVYQNSTNTSATTPDKFQPVLLRSDTVTNNLAAIQSLRIRLRLQSALFRENVVLHANKPTALQLSVPHDPRIDLIPTPHMRDRMIIFRDQFDLDDCLRLLVNDAFFHGGDPTVAGNWELPTSFFEKYWFLTIDYTQERTSKQWKQLKTKSTTTNEPPTIYPAVSSEHSLQEKFGDVQHSTDSMHHGRAQHHQSTPASIPSLIGRQDNTVRQSNDANNYDPPPPSTANTYGFTLLVDNASLYQGQPLDSIQQNPEIQPQPPWTQPFPFTDP